MAEALRVTTSKGIIGVRCWETGGPTVVLLHGIPGSGRSWTAVAERLAQEGRVLVPDLIGFGDSARSDDIAVLHAEGQAAALEEMLRWLGISRAVVVGHDFGGPVALTLAQQSPELVAGLGLLATNAFSDTPIPFPLSTVTWPVLGPLAARLLFSAPSLLAMMRQGVGSPRRRIDVRGAVGDRRQRRAIRLIFGASLTRLNELYRPIQDRLGRIEVPTLVAWGERDRFLTPEQGRRTATAIPAARLRVYPKAGHFLPEERPEEVASDLAALLSAVAARP
ncbi:MAG: alpha/beta fold hydrolase [Acidimicrobiales bacterium]